MLAALDEVLAYQHPAVVRRFQKEHPGRAGEAEQIFKDLLLFFWSSKKHSYDRSARPADSALDFVYIMDDEMRDIDQMWHVFLLYTKDYEEFCRKYFGEFLHHLPDIVPTFEQGSFDFTANLEKFIGYVYDELGEAVVRRWFPVSCGG